MDGLPPNTWYNFSAIQKEYLYHDECFIASSQSAVESVCIDTHNGANVASLSTTPLYNWISNTLMTSQPVVGSSGTCREYNTAPGNTPDRFVTIGGTFIKDNNEKRDPDGLIWWNGDTYNPAVLIWDTGEPNSPASSEPGVFLSYIENTIHDGPFSGTQRFGTICERPMPTSNPTWNPMMDPTINPTSDPTNYPSYNPTSDPITDPTKDPTTNPTNNPSGDPSMKPTMPPTYTAIIALKISYSDPNVFINDIINVTQESLTGLYGTDSNIQVTIVSTDDEIELSVIVDTYLNPDIINDQVLQTVIQEKLIVNNYDVMVTIIGNDLEINEVSTTKPSLNESETTKSSSWVDGLSSTNFWIICAITLIFLSCIIAILLCYLRKIHEQNDMETVAKMTSISVTDNNNLEMTNKEKNTTIDGNDEEEEDGDDLYLSRQKNVQTPGGSANAALGVSTSGASDVSQESSDTEDGLYQSKATPNDETRGKAYDMNS